MSNDFLHVVLGISIASQLIPIIIGKKQNNPLLWSYILTGFCFDIALTVCKRVIEIDGFDYHFVGNLFFAIEFIFITIYYDTYAKLFSSKIIFVATLTIPLIIYLITFIDGTLISGKGIAVFATLYAIYSLVGFHKILVHLKNNKIEESAFFWVNTALIIYAAGSLPILIAIDYMLENNKETAYILWVFRNIINIAKSIIFAKALTLNERD